MIPFFTKDIKDVKGLSTINARSETIATSRTYREPFKKRRCLVPASGFYEWKRLDPKNKQPFAFDLANGRMMAFAGLWDDLGFICWPPLDNDALYRMIARTPKEMQRRGVVYEARSLTVL